MDNKDTIVVNGSSGMFSCFTIRLQAIIDYYNKYHKLPVYVDSRYQFSCYKQHPDEDITHLLLKSPRISKNDQNDLPPTFVWSSSPEENQFSDYEKLNFSVLKKLVQIYFSPSDNVIETCNFLKEKYNIDINNTCCIYYRGNDKQTETNLPSYEEFIIHAKKIQDLNPNMCFLIQTDEEEFNKLCYEQLRNVIHIQENSFFQTRTMSSRQYVIPNDTKHTHAIYYISTIYLISQCKYIIHTSGNGELWITLWRGNSKNMLQYLNPKEYIHGVYNEFYNPNKTEFWIKHYE